MSTSPAPQEIPPPQPPQPPQPPTGGGRALFGWLLLIVPLVALVYAYVLPTLRAIDESTRSGSGFGAEGAPVGGENYSKLFGDQAFLEGVLTYGLVALGSALSGAVVAFLVAWCVHLAGRGVRLAGRIIAVLAALSFAPLAWTVALKADEFERFTEPGSQMAEAVSLSSWVAIASGTVFGIGLLVGLAAFRGGADTGRRVGTVLAAAGLTGLAILAAGLQAYTFSALTGLRPTSPLAHVYGISFRNADFGLGQAASVAVLVPLALLGLAAAFLVIGARVRIDIAPGPEQPRPFRAGPGIGAIVLLALFATGTLMTLWPWLSRIGDGSAEPYESGTVLSNTWGTALVTTGIGFAAALAGAIAIGTLRPLGDKSLWLLLPFAPWLFVGSGPLALSNYMGLRDAEDYGTYMSLAPRAWIAVPALFLLTALFWGLENRRRAMLNEGWSPGAAGATLFRAGWPLAALVGLAVLVANGQDSYWQSLTGLPDQPNAWVAMVSNLTSLMNFDAGFGVGVGYPVAIFLPLAVAAVAAAIWYLPRVAIHIGK
ncbi:sugar ABC transporter permease [Glycomyces sp. NRRL B-16210]|uniref:sugar ABC transporter permease n=1 Tax=Glycomyces sp. NRRL B-16210 TaxID=1463821 RepID=UPI0004BE635B|nr:sugar ABC transporter permease [Glycomyces sp. NRRL B-16210]